MVTTRRKRGKPSGEEEAPEGQGQTQRKGGQSQSQTQSRAKTQTQKGAEIDDDVKARYPMSVMAGIAAAKSAPSNEATEDTTATHSSSSADHTLQSPPKRARRNEHHKPTSAAVQSTGTERRGTEDTEQQQLIQVDEQSGGKNQIVIRPEPSPEENRTSRLRSPILLFAGHGDQIYTNKFSPDGQSVASSGKDKTIFLWKVYDDNENYGVLRGHKNAILDLEWSADSIYIGTASADRTVGLWDVEMAKRVKTFNEHESIVNSCSIGRRGPNLLASGSDDGTIKIWDTRQRQSVHTFNSRFPVTSVAFSDDATSIFSGGIDNEIHQWELSSERHIRSLQGHSDMITGLSLSPTGNFLLSNSMDQSLRQWDVRPYVKDEHNRCSMVYTGHQHNFEKLLLKCAWSSDGERVAAGSSDQIAYVWRTDTGKIEYALPGHDGTITEIAFHPTEPVIVSCATDRQIFLGELSHL